MKKNYFLLLALLFTAMGFSQIVSIPDANFKAKLLAANTNNAIAKNSSNVNMKIDTNNDLQIQESEALLVYKLDVNSSDISNLTGVGAFLNLIELNCRSNDITTLDVSMLANLLALRCYNNAITSLNVTGANNLISLSCYDNLLTNLNVSGLINLLGLSCQDNQITSLDVSGFTNLENLNCYNNQLSYINLNGLTNLETLLCYENELTDLNVAGLSSLTELNCHSNNLSSLSLMNLTNLTSVNCYQNELTNLTLSGLTSLTNVNASSNQLSSLSLSNCPIINSLNCNNNSIVVLNVAEISNITSLSCSNNQLTTLDVSSLTQLSTLNASNNQLTMLNVAGTNLYDFDCSHNQLTSLDFTNVLITDFNNFNCSNNLLNQMLLKENSTYFEFDCSHNLLVNLPTISAFQLNCSYNLLTTFNDTIGYNELDCSHNQLTAINFSNPNNNFVDIIDCSYNQLETINIPYYFNEALICDHNNLISIIVPYADPILIFSFGNNPNLQYICTNADLAVVVEEQLLLLGYNNVEVNSYCTFTPGGTFYTIQGNHKFDFNNNGCDANDVIVQNQKFTITDGTTVGNIVSDETGNYNIRVQAGSHTITPVLESPNYYTITPTSLPVVFPAQSSPVNQNFCITPNGVHPDLEITLIPTNSASPGFDVTYKIIYKNKGTNTQSGSFSFVFDGDILDFVTSNPSTASQLPNTLTWNFSNLAPFESGQVEFTLNLNAPTETPPVNGDDILHFSATIASAATDDSPADNTATLNQTVFNSFDPNDKTCLEGSNITPEMIGNYVHYKIRFENTGTAYAQRIIVSDKIDLAKFDIATLVPIDGSHAFTTRIYDGNKVEFIFENIQLPFDDENNDGYVVFKIKTLPTLVLGDNFSNSAAIYFDYNYPIFTNEAVTTIQVLGTPDFDFGNYFTLYPNPAIDVLNIASKEEITITSIAIYNTLGQLVIMVPNAQNVSSIDVSNLTTGNYFIKVASDKGSSNARFIKN